MIRSGITHWVVIAVVALLFAKDCPAGVNGPFQLTSGSVITDQAGRVLIIARPYKRIISLYGAHTENLLDLGLQQEIIGVTRQDCKLEKVAGRTVFSYHDDPEKFLAARPDLVLIRPMIDRGYARLMRRLEQSGIRVVSIQPGTIKEMYRYWIILGRLTGRDAEARRMVESFRKAVADFQQIAKTVDHPKRVYFQAMHKQMKTFSEGSMADFVLKTAGGINIAADAIPSRGTNIAIYGKEKILAHARDIDVFLAQRGAMNQPTIEQIQREPGFSAIKAVRHRRIFIIDEEITSRPTRRLLEGICRISAILYPDRYPQSLCRPKSLAAGGRP